jgi:hypothetical protein
MDNTGPYISYADLLLELADGESPRVKKSLLTLGTKTADVGGDLFEYSVAVGQPTPLIGDVLEQAGFTTTIKELLTSPLRLRIDQTGVLNLLASGTANLLHSDSVSKRRAESLIQDAMNKIDLDTGQFFNKRTGTFWMEGNNSHILHLGLPIIDITKLLINNSAAELKEGDDYDFVAFKGRAEPQDDRRNPRIKLNVRNDSIFSGVLTNRVFVVDTRTRIEGSFGFLEPNGSTPRLIQRATKRLVVRDIENPIASDAATSSRGGLRRIKVDLHEKEFFELRGTNRASVPSDDQEYNQIVMTYRRPILVGGSFKELGV